MRIPLRYVNNGFSLWYIDAFAGAGSSIESSTDEDSNDIRRFVSGSVERAINIRNKRFDKLVF